ncbi:hypothetical protein JX265_000019 [Neoarthrinium moseri]|uniref:Signal recognition particle subunit SRP68 n=1 Tax=Neoarthrinium moseri TaxID=1658444 RepID=A0A9Q0AUI3_9PEZI|nr:hypothetical protein JX265_000019 [Neoarthrinium moseri]
MRFRGVGGSKTWQGLTQASRSHRRTLRTWSGRVGWRTRGSQLELLPTTAAIIDFLAGPRCSDIAGREQRLALHMRLCGPDPWLTPARLAPVGSHRSGRQAAEQQLWAEDLPASHFEFWRAFWRARPYVDAPVNPTYWRRHYQLLRPAKRQHSTTSRGPHVFTRPHTPKPPESSLRQASQHGTSPAMDITNFVVAARNQALLYGDYSTYHRQLGKKLLSCRKKLGISIKSRGKYNKKGDYREILPDQISENHAWLHLLLLTAERAWSHAMELKALHSTDTQGITGRTRSHIISRLDKAAKVAERLVELLADQAASGASPTDGLEAKAYAALIRGAERFEKQSWEPCLRSYSTARVIYIALSTVQNPDIAKDLLSETIDPSIRYAAYQLKIPRTQAIPTIAKKAFPSDSSLVDQIDKIDPSLLKETGADAQKGQADAPNAPQSINWRSREVKIEDASIAVALASTEAAVAQLKEKLASPEVTLPKEMAAAYDGVLIASQDAADATKHAIDELKEEGVSQNDSRVQSLQITRTAVNYQMISWRIGRNRVLSGNHDGALLDSAPNTTRKAKKESEQEHGSKRPKSEAPGRKIARLKEKVVLYDATLQSLDSIKELPGVAADEDLQEQLDATYKYFHALKCLSIARSHSLAENSVNALALTRHAFNESQKSAAFFSKQMSTSIDGAPLNIEIRDTDIEFLTNLLKGELQRCRALVEIDNLRAKKDSSGIKSTAPLVQRLYEYPTEGADLENLVTYPPKLEPIPVKPLFFDVAWNYIDYPGQTPVASTKAEVSQQKSDEGTPKKKGWFGFGRG